MSASKPAGLWRQIAVGLMALALAFGPAQTRAEAAVLLVTRFDDPAPNGCASGTDCSLREAVLQANTNGGLDVIQLPAGVYTLTVAGVDDTGNLGDLDFTGPTQLGVTGGLSASIGAESSLLDRIMDVITGSVAVTMTDIIIHGGDPLNNTAGGVRVAANTSLWLERVTVRDNLAGAGGGGGLLTAGRLTMVDSLVTRNRAPNGGQGGGILATSGAVVVLTNTVILSNTTSSTGGAHGGGILLQANTKLTMSGGGLISNTASGNGGGLITFASNPVVLTGVQVLTNTALQGGGVLNFGPLTMANSLVRGNTATLNGGGGLRAESGLTLTASAVISNVATNSTGGGLNVSSGVTAVITNVTFSDNLAQLSGGAVSAGATSVVLLHHVSVISNTTILGNGGGLNSIQLGGLSNSLVAGNRDLSAGAQQPDCAVGTRSLGYNLIGNSTGCGLLGNLTGVISNTLALVGPLAYNSGLTPTHALRLGSPAFNSANPANCAPTDQLGASRPAGPGCDLGAWEGDQALVFVPIAQK